MNQNSWAVRFIINRNITVIDQKQLENVESFNIWVAF